jgi:hypothetical protein
MRHSIASIIFAVACSLPSVAHAVNPTIAERIGAAMAESRYADAVTLIDELERASGPSLRSRWARAQALLLGERNADANTAAGVCLDTAAHSTEAFAATARTDCERIRDRARAALSAAVPVAPVPPPVAAPPTVAAVAPVRRVVAVTPPRSLAPTTPAVALLSVGAASLAASVVFGVLANDATSDCTVQNDVATCATQEGLARARTSTDYATGANVALGVGLGAVGAGAAWWIATALRSPTPVVVSVSADGVVVAGRF